MDSPIGRPADDVAATRLVTANCHEVEAPWCSAQIGCTYNKTVCTWREDLDPATLTLTGWIIWSCKDVGASYIRACKAV